MYRSPAGAQCSSSRPFPAFRRLTYMQYLNMLSKGLVGEALDQKERESAAYLECVPMSFAFFCLILTTRNQLRTNTEQLPARFSTTYTSAGDWNGREGAQTCRGGFREGVEGGQGRGMAEKGERCYQPSKWGCRSDERGNLVCCL